MKKQIILGLLLLAYPFFSGNAQKIDNANKTSEQDSAMEAIQKSAVANSFYEKLQQGEKAKSNDWTLTRAYFSPNTMITVGGKAPIVTDIFLENRRINIKILISEHEIGSVPSYFMPVSQAIVKNCKSSLCGDEGRKVYGMKNEFTNLEFRKGNFRISITCDSEETAMRFAGYALKAIAEK